MNLGLGTNNIGNNGLGIPISNLNINQNNLIQNLTNIHMLQSLLPLQMPIQNHDNFNLRNGTGSGMSNVVIPNLPNLVSPNSNLNILHKNNTDNQNNNQVSVFVILLLDFKRP
jgi:hypothetical protein